MSDTTTISRRQLYEDIWSTPLGELSRKYGISNEAIVRACKRHSIPRPGSGYWSKKRAGWADPPTPLPPADDPRLETVTLTEEHPDDVQDEAVPVRHAVDDEVNRRIEQELAAAPIVVPEKLRSPHRLVAAAMAEHSLREADERRRKSDPINYSRGAIEPKVRANVSAHSKETRDRAYRIMDTLLNALEERGYDVGGPPQEFGGTTLVNVLGMTFDVRLHEPCRRKVHLLTPDEQERKKKYGSVFAPAHDSVPTGRLCLEFRCQNAVFVLAHRKDGERVRLEDSLKDLIVAVLRKVDEERQAARERARRDSVRRDAETRQKQEADRQQGLIVDQEEEDARVRGLLAEVKRWRDSQEIQAYLEHIRRVISERNQTIRPGSDFERWMAWADSVATRLDPLTPSAPLAPTRPAGGDRS
jgi:hypothetical protein